MCARRKIQISLSIPIVRSVSSFPYELTLHPWLSQLRPGKILIRLCECTGWSESSLDAHVHRYVFWPCDSFVFCIFSSTKLLSDIWTSWSLPQTSLSSWIERGSIIYLKEPDLKFAPTTHMLRIVNAIVNSVDLAASELLLHCWPSWKHAYIILIPLNPTFT